MRRTCAPVPMRRQAMAGLRCRDVSLATDRGVGALRASPASSSTPNNRPSCGTSS
jgi:hypothetical protein